MSDDAQHLARMKETYERRLKILEQQAATFGISAPAHILIEIEDLKAKLAALEAPSSTDAPQSGTHTNDMPTRILFLAADPTNAARLRLGEEFRDIQEKLQMAKLRDKFELHQRMSVRPTDISQALLDVQPHIVHFSGHGEEEGALSFENLTGQIHPVEPSALAALFEQFADGVQCVLLNACYSRKQANAIAKHIPYVIGMKRAIGDRAAIAFAIGFYQAIGAGRTIPQAFELGTVQIRLQGIEEHLTPVLVEKKG